jgi:hypothetical protein
VGSSNDCICTLADHSVADHATDAAGRHGRPRRAVVVGDHASAAHRDRVDLLDEADRAPFRPCGLAQRGEVRPDLLGSGAVVHRLEGRGRDEQERHADLGGHRLGGHRLAGPRKPFEEQAAARRSAHLLGEPAVGLEQVDGAPHVLLDRVDPDDVVERDVDLLRAVGDVR